LEEGKTFIKNKYVNNVVKGTVQIKKDLIIDLQNTMDIHNKQIPTSTYFNSLRTQD